MTTISVAQHLEVVTRRQAKELGLIRYFTGVPCKRGHLDYRLVVNASCISCANLANKKDREKHADKRSQKQKQWRTRNPENYRARNARYYEANREIIREKQKAYSALNSEKAVLRAMSWGRRNPEAKSVRVAKRRAIKTNRLPSWYGELDAFVWSEAIRLVRLRNKTTTVPWNADHTIPLIGKEVCGLHLGCNCQVIPAILNRQKGNKLTLTEFAEWIKLT
jgi:hypothetical protein